MEPNNAASQGGDSRPGAGPVPTGKADGETPMDIGTFMNSYLQPGAAQGLYNAQLLQQGNFPFNLPMSLLQQQAEAISHQTTQLRQAGATATATGAEAEPAASDGGAEEGKTIAKRKRGRAKKDQRDEPEQDDMKGSSLQEKNRRAQQRFRQRQKEKLEELMEEVEGLNSALKKVKAEKTTLQNHSNILEKVLANKDEDIQSMTHRLRVLEAQEGGTPANKDESLQVTDAEGHAVTIVRAKLAGELSNLWRGFVNKLAGALVEGGSVHPRTEVIDKIDSLVSDACAMCKEAALFEPNSFKSWLFSSLQETPGADPEQTDNQQRWKDIVRSLTLTPQQKREIKELRRMHLGKLEALAFEVKKLGDIPFVEIDATGHPAGSPTTMNLAKQYLVHDDVATALTNIVRQQNNMQLEFDATLYRGILTSLQMARVIVQSYPRMPDGLVIVNCVDSDS